jgi:hypothetical protein
MDCAISSLVLAARAAVLELGSGTGNYIIALAQSTGCARGASIAPRAC